jgi:hypothetical protein
MGRELAPSWAEQPPMPPHAGCGSGGVNDRVAAHRAAASAGRRPLRHSLVSASVSAVPRHQQLGERERNAAERQPVAVHLVMLITPPPNTAGAPRHGVPCSSSTHGVMWVPSGNMPGRRGTPPKPTTKTQIQSPAPSIKCFAAKWEGSLRTSFGSIIERLTDESTGRDRGRTWRRRRGTK